MLDQSPHNELGKGVLDPEQEQRLLAQGFVYAKRVFHGDNSYHLRLSKSPIRPIANDITFGHLLNNTLVFNHAQ